MENFRRYWWLGLCFWVLVAFVSWHYESSCGVFFYSDCFSSYWIGIRWIALLEWVFPYQTLIAGLAAIGGGYFVLKSQMVQIEENRRVVAQNKKESFRAAITTIRSECIHVADHLDSDNLTTSDQSLEFTRALMPVLANNDGRLLHVTMSVTYRLEKALREKARGNSSGFSPTKIGWYSSIGLSYAEMLAQVMERLDAGQDASVSHSSFDGYKLYSYLEKRGQDPSILFELGPYFRWPVEQGVSKDMWRPA